MELTIAWVSDCTGAAYDVVATSSVVLSRRKSTVLSVVMLITDKTHCGPLLTPNYTSVLVGPSAMH